MSDATNTTNAQPGGAPPSAEPPKQTLMQKATQWAGIGLAVVLLLIGAAKIYNWLVPSLPGCISEGDTVEEALDNTKEAIELHIESMRAHGQA